jgi:uncharacterized membrane protein YqjE
MIDTKDGVSAASLLLALRSLAATLLASAKTRMELIANEIEVEKLRATEFLLVLFAMTFCFGLAIVLAVIFLTVLFWEQRLAVLAVCALAFLLSGFVLLLHFKRESRRGRVLADSLAELERDLHQLKAMTGHEPPSR